MIIVTIDSIHPKKLQIFHSPVEKINKILHTVLLLYSTLHIDFSFRRIVEVLDINKAHFNKVHI